MTIVYANTRCPNCNYEAALTETNSTGETDFVCPTCGQWDTWERTEGGRLVHTHGEPRSSRLKQSSSSTEPFSIEEVAEHEQ